MIGTRVEAACWTAAVSALAIAAALIVTRKEPQRAPVVDRCARVAPDARIRCIENEVVRIDAELMRTRGVGGEALWDQYHRYHRELELLHADADRDERARLEADLAVIERQRDAAFLVTVERPGDTAAIERFELLQDMTSDLERRIAPLREHSDLLIPPTPRDPSRL